MTSRSLVIFRTRFVDQRLLDFISCLTASPGYKLRLPMQTYLMLAPDMRAVFRQDGLSILLQ